MTPDAELPDMTPDDPRVDPSRPAAWRERLAAYLDDRMSPQDARTFLAWLERHPEAWKEAEAARRVWTLLGAYRDEPVPEGFADRVLAKVGLAAGTPPAAAPLRFLAGGRTRALAAAAILVALGAGALVGRGLGAPSPTSAPAPADPTVAALDRLPAGALDELDGDRLVQLASLSDAEFAALLSADSQDLATSGN